MAREVEQVFEHQWKKFVGPRKHFPEYNEKITDKGRATKFTTKLGILDGGMGMFVSAFLNRGYNDEIKKIKGLISKHIDAELAYSKACGDNKVSKKRKQALYQEVLRTNEKLPSDLRANSHQKLH